VAKLAVHDLGKTFRPTGKWSWLAGLDDDGTDDDDGDGVVPRAWLKREITAFSNVSFSLGAGEALGIVGPGRTSLLRVIAGLTAPTTGYVTGQGSVVYMNGLRQAPYPKLSLRTNLQAVAELCVGRRMDRRRRDASIEKAADLLDMHSRLDTPSYWFHPNQFGSLAYAAVIAFRPEIMLFDEILHPGEPDASEWVTAELRQHLSSGGIVVIASRRTYVAQTFSPEVYNLGGNDTDDNDLVDEPPREILVGGSPAAPPPPEPTGVSPPRAAGAAKAGRPEPVDLHISTDGYFVGSRTPLENQDDGRWQDIPNFASSAKGPGQVARDISPDEAILGTPSREVFAAVHGLGMLRAVRTRTDSGRAANQVRPGETVVIDVYFDTLVESAGVDIVAAFSVALLDRARTKILTPPNKVAVARLPSALSCPGRGSYRASCHFDGQLTRAMAVTYLVTADVSMTFWDEAAGARQKPKREQLLDAQVHWIIRSDWSQNPRVGYYGAAPLRISALFPMLRWDIKYDRGGSSK